MLLQTTKFQLTFLRLGHSLYLRNQLFRNIVHALTPTDCTVYKVPRYEFYKMYYMQLHKTMALLYIYKNI